MNGLFLFILTFCLFGIIAVIPTSAADYEVAEQSPGGDVPKAAPQE